MACEVEHEREHEQKRCSIRSGTGSNKSTSMTINMYGSIRRARDHHREKHRQLETILALPWTDEDYRLGDVLGEPWGRVGRLGGVLEASWRHLGRLGGVLEASWRRLGGVLERLGGVLEAKIAKRPRKPNLKP